MWIAVPACAAAGVVTFTVVAAQEAAPPAGYYTPRFTPHPSVMAEQNKPIRPLNDSPPPGLVDRDPPSRPYQTPAKPKPLPLPISTADTAAPSRPRFFPDAVPVPVRQVSATSADMPGLPPPTMSPPSLSSPTPLPLMPSLAPPSLAPPSLPSLAPPTLLPTLPPPTLAPPSVTFEASEPAKLEPKLLPTPAPLPNVSVVPAPAMTAVPTTPLPTRQAPTVVLETIAPETIGVGQTLTYELVVRNTGANAVANVRIEDELPAGAAFLSSEPVAEQAGSRLGWSLGVLEGGAEKHIRISVKPSDEGELRSRAVATFSTAAEARIRVTKPRISVTMTAGEAARIGDEVPLTIRIANTGTGAAQKLLVQAKLSDGLHHAQGTVIEAELASLPPGETKTVVLRATATKAGPQTCVLSATADGTPAEPARVALNVVEPLLTAKLVGPAKCLVRAEPTYQLELGNPGTAATDPVQAWAVLPEGFDFVGASDGGTFSAANRTVAWKLPAMPAGSNRPLTMKLRAAAPVDGTVRIVAQAVAEAAPSTGVVRTAAATRVLEAKAEVAVRAEGVAALRFEVIDVEDPVEVGKEAVYEIKIMNQGTAPCTNVTIVATLADGTTVAGVSGPTAGRGVGQAVTFDPVATLNAKSEAVFQVRVKCGVAGDQKFKVQVACDQMRTPTVKEENTRFTKE